MPIYEYVCQSCGHRAEVIQKVDDPAPAACPACSKGPMARQVSRTSFQLKGGGWYADLYGSTPQKAPAEGAAAPKAEGEGGKGGPATPPKDGGAKDAGAGGAGAAAPAGGTATPSAPKTGGGSGGEG